MFVFYVFSWPFDAVGPDRPIGLALGLIGLASSGGSKVLVADLTGSGGGSGLRLRVSLEGLQVPREKGATKALVDEVEAGEKLGLGLGLELCRVSGDRDGRTAAAQP